MKKLFRSILFFFPSVYDFASPYRYWLNYYLKKVHEADFKAFELISEKHPQLFLDVGANVGMSALSIFTVKPNAKIISFEPNPINYSHLDRIADRFDSFEYKKFGLSDKDELLNLYSPIYRNKRVTGLASFDYKSAEKSRLHSKTIYFFDVNKKSVECITSEVKTLDSLKLNPDYIKIDVQGFEYQVLSGARETINRCKPIFLIERVKPDGDVYNFLKDFGYFIYQFKSGKFLLNRFNSRNQFLFPQEKLHLIQDKLGS